MKPPFVALSVTSLFSITVSVYTAGQAKPTDRSAQVYGKADLVEWNRGNTAGNEDPLPGRFAFNRHQTTTQDAFRGIGWPTLPLGVSISEHKHTDNEDICVIVSSKGVSTDSASKQTQVGAGDVTIAHPGQSYALKNVGKESLAFLDLITETTAKSAAVEK